MWKGPKQNVAVKLPLDLHMAVKAKAGGMLMSLESAYQQALENWLAPADVIAPAPSPYVAKLETILSSNDEMIIDAVTQNIEVFYERLRPRQKPSKRRAG